MSTPRAEFLTGVKATIPLVIGAFPFGVIFGAAAVTTGISPAGTVAMSLFVFAGSAEFIGVGLVKAGVSVPIIILTTFVVNLRHALYSATLAPYVKRLPQRWLVPLGFMLTDEAFVVASTHYVEPTDNAHKHWYFFGSEILLYVCWQIFTWIGIVAGTMIPDPTRLGLDFAMSVTFIGMLVPLIKDRPVLATVVVASVVAVLTATMPNKIGLILATLAGVAAGVIVEARSGAAPEPVIASEEIPRMSDNLQALFEDFTYGLVCARFEIRAELPPDALISNVTVIPFIGDRVVIIRLADGRYEVPGGTREPDEPYLTTARRELIEEAGAHLLSYVPFGAWHCTSSAEKPYRSHLPHPEFYRVAGYGEVELVSQPTNPPDGEQVAAVEALTVEEAAAAFVASGRPDLADLYRLAARFRHEAQQRIGQ